MSITELHPDTLLQKTEAGLAEMKSRQLGLQQRERSLLIMVDGKQSIASLLEKMPDKALSLRLLEGLLVKGLIAPKPDALNASSRLSGKADSDPKVPTAERTSEQVAEPTVANTTANNESLAKGLTTFANDAEFKSARMRASRALHDILGPSAEQLCIAIEECKTPDAFFDRLEKTSAVLSRVRSESVAQAYRSEVLSEPK